MNYMFVLLFPWVAAGIWIASISAGLFSLNISVYGFLHLLFLRASILVGLTSNEVDDSSRPWNTKTFLTSCPKPFL